MATLGQLQKALGNPNARAFLDLIANAEGVQHGYNTLFGNQKFNSLSRHPNIKKQFKQTNGKVNYTTAAGRYQFLNGTWNGLAKQYGFRSFSPQEQDLGALALIAQNGALEQVLRGDFKGAVGKLGGVWASLPSSNYAQPKKTYAQLGLTGQSPKTPYRTQQSRQNSLILAAIMGDYSLGDTGIGSGDHYDLRLASVNGKRGDINPYLNRFYANGKGLHTYKQTGRYLERRKRGVHEGVDFGINGSFGGNKDTRNLYISPEWASRVQNITAFDNRKHGGGWVTQVTFDDGIKVNILHQNQKGTQQVIGAWGNRGSQAQPQRPQRPQRQFLSQDEIARVLPNLAKPQSQAKPQRQFLSSDEIARVLPNLAKPKPQRQFLSPDEIAKVLPNLKLN